MALTARVPERRDGIEVEPLEVLAYDDASALVSEE
jgi:hypothetical protein